MYALINGSVLTGVIFFPCLTDNLWLYVKGCYGLTLSLQPTGVFMFMIFFFFPLWWACQRTKQNSALFHLHCLQSEFIMSHHRKRSVSCFCYNNKWRKVSINGSCWNLKPTKLSHHNFIVETITLSDYNEGVMIILSTVFNNCRILPRVHQSKK